ncbi:acetyl/propionyl/methylcrotonyl-CoA carboxylase subunit alpha [Psychrobium sp. 1_MG-2023]|uniref:acetyl/propionyl/methylcrotonyl-CoA carboxylase subunit alpha n=1 Tax=Psychrobium sp. 1_MG-2023 TaxID=3062624 RepID=UPI000C3453A8|nr:acetyl/propionyl/methylcrotonyl-CoA carboxylase subunit alpha [Psychrobium sp. 1_MG-2023]MDP2559895.1 acetyl/propionyl/methylcrotonyl-CoA carboxylase subunit alpha [Psychrobium sp. 1_MG-2023]PKF59004.1 3-methylcrotonyl-CoA carboxylase [Alteromonadales bacterium alter-6D02]
MFDKILIANRGEIACRIIKTCHELGIRCVALYSDADKDALHVKMADEAFHIGPAPAKDSYLKMDNILAAAKESGAQAIHPGYGFMSENVEFAQACLDNDITFIGPPVAAIDAMGSKSAAKEIMTNAGVPLVPGYHGEEQDPAFLKQQSAEIGYPQLLKAAYGGGGKGMRVVWSEDEFDAALASTKREAIAGFGNDKMLIERYLTKPRHVEIQVFADSHGNCIYLSERDCSIQRRHQKVIEEAPAPNLSQETRVAMGEAAVAAAKAINYQGAGTVEFLFDEDGSFYFMEMNTRLQVEHPVTEMITGLDLVSWQLKAAYGEPLPLNQEQVTIDGHSIEVRIYAEDPDNEFLPATGSLDYLRQPPASNHVRVDTGVIQNDQVSSFYDPMIAKLIVWDDTRERAIARMSRALEDYRIGGLKTNLGFLANLVDAQPFKDAELDTGFIEKHQDLLFTPKNETCYRALMLASLAILEQQKHQASPAVHLQDNDPFSPWGATNAWRLNESALHTIELTDSHENSHLISVEQLNDSYRFTFDGQAFIATAILDNDHLVATINGHKTSLLTDISTQQVSLFIKQEVHHFSRKYHDGNSFEVDESDDKLTAPMNGTIVDVPVNANQLVKAGDVLVIMEAMKMEYSITAPHDGTVNEVYFHTGDMVKDGELLIDLTATEG